MNKLKKLIENPEVVSKTPVITVLFLEGANISQLWRMWSNWTADGQSLIGWIMVNLALLLWLNFYRVCTPQQKWAIWSTAFGVAMNSLVIISVIVHRYIL